MSIELASFNGLVSIVAEDAGLLVKSSVPIDWNDPSVWPSEVTQSAVGIRLSYEISNLLELGLGESQDVEVRIPYDSFSALKGEDFTITEEFTQECPFLLKIDRAGDIGRQDFRYRYEFLLGTKAVPIDRVGFYVRRSTANQTYHLDPQMFALVEAMDRFNRLPPEDKKSQGWLTFAGVKELSGDVSAILESTLQRNEVIVPSQIGLDMYEDANGALSFVPRCADLDGQDFRALFERNNAVESFYTLDRPGMGKVRIVLTEKNREVLRRMKRVRKVLGPLKEELKSHPEVVFDGILGDIDLPYSDRVTGIGEFHFFSTLGIRNEEGALNQLWGPATSTGPDGEQTPRIDEPASEDAGPVDSTPQDPANPQSDSVGPDGPAADPALTDPGGSPSEEELFRAPRPAKQTLLIATHDESISQQVAQNAEMSKAEAGKHAFVRPVALLGGIDLKKHQEEGIRWLQSCTYIDRREGVLLADDMGVGKTLQILSFLAWAIESGRFPDLSKPKPPYRPILIVAPLILLETETWQREMEKFFADNGSVFGDVLPLYGAALQAYRRRDAEGREDVVAKPILNLDRIRKHQVVITNYEAVRDYEFSFAYHPDGKPLWSIIVSDEAHEYKTPNSKISHAMKALSPDFRIACTGTPVENRLLDLWNLMDAIQPGLLGTGKEFNARYESTKSPDDEARFAELKTRLLYQRHNAFLLRRSKAEVLELPAKRVHKLKCIMSEAEVRVHKQLVAGMSASQKPQSRLMLLHKFARFYQHPALLESTGDDLSGSALTSSSSKLSTVIGQLKQIKDLEEKVIIFARHKDVQRLLARVIGNNFRIAVGIINGDTPKSSGYSRVGAETRDKLLTRFRTDPGFQVLILSPFVAGVGLTIVEANHVIHYGRWWNPAVEEQATDRAYRLGQQKEVHVYLPILEDPSGRINKTFDQLLDELMEKKKLLAAGTLSKDEFLRPADNEELLGLEVFTQLEESV